VIPVAGGPGGFLGEALEKALLREELLRSPRRGGGLRAAVARAVREERRPALILEFKRCRPGGFVEYMEPWRFLELLGGAADAFSVLAEPYWFCGSPELVAYIAAVGGKPVLYKDFVAGGGLLRQAASAGASAVLLILDMLGWRRLGDLYEEARGLGLEALIETSSSDDAVEAMGSFPGALVGINARNLETLEVSFERLLEEVRKAAGEKPRDALLVAESSIDSTEKALALARAGADALLIGTWAVRSPREVARLPERLRRALGE